MEIISYLIAGIFVFIFVEYLRLKKENKILKEDIKYKNGEIENLLHTLNISQKKLNEEININKEAKKLYELCQRSKLNAMHDII